MAEWFIEEYMLGASGAGNPNIVGYYIDDGWAADVKSNAHGLQPVVSAWGFCCVCLRARLALRTRQSFRR